MIEVGKSNQKEVSTSQLFKEQRCIDSDMEKWVETQVQPKWLQKEDLAFKKN